MKHERVKAERIHGSHATRVTCSCGFVGTGRKMAGHLLATTRARIKKQADHLLRYEESSS